MKFSPNKPLREVGAITRLARETGKLALMALVVLHSGPLRIEIRGKIIELSGRVLEPAREARSPAG